MIFSGNEDCVELNSAYDYDWNDEQCEEKRRFICGPQGNPFKYTNCCAVVRISTTGTLNSNAAYFGNFKRRSLDDSTYKHESGNYYLFYTKKAWMIGPDTINGRFENNNGTICPEDIQENWIDIRDSSKPPDINVQCYINKSGTHSPYMTYVYIGSAVGVVLVGASSIVAILKMKKKTALDNAQDEEPYDNGTQYDYAEFHEGDLPNRRRANQTTQAQGNGQKRILQTVHNPSFEAGGSNIDDNQLGAGNFKTIKVTENPYYGVMSLKL